VIPSSAKVDGVAPRAMRCPRRASAHFFLKRRLPGQTMMARSARRGMFFERFALRVDPLIVGL
jgi:hypothetical protein